MEKEMEFFIYLLENYASYKKVSANIILKQWDELDLTNIIYDMYERYHIECIENAYDDIDKLMEDRKNSNF